MYKLQFIITINVDTDNQEVATIEAMHIADVLYGEAEIYDESADITVDVYKREDFPDYLVEEDDYELDPECLEDGDVVYTDEDNV